MSLIGKAIWRLAKWARTGALEATPPPQFPPLRDATGTLKTSNKDNAEILADTLYPPPGEADLTDITGTNYPLEVEMKDEITGADVSRAIKSLPLDKAPGPDQITNGMLKNCQKTLQEPLRKLYQACVRIQYHPKQFKVSTTIILRKPQKPDYTVAKAFRPIALLNTLGKLLERIVAD